MKKRMPHATLLLLLIPLLICSGCDPDDMGKSNAALRREIEQLETKCSKLTEDNQKLKDESESQKKQIRELEDETEVTKWRFRFLLALFLVILGLPSALFFGLFFRKPKASSQKKPDNKCPICHWKIDPDMRECPNPDCRTRFG